MDPIAEQLPLPPEYGTPSKLVSWEQVRRELEDAPVYWVASTRPDGRPHVVPRDGIWLDDTWFYGGSPQTVHNRNIGRNPAVAMHIGDGMRAIIVEGTSRFVHPPREVAVRLAEVSNRKYAHYELHTTPETYTDGGAWALAPDRVIAWNVLFEDATRFRFPA